MDSGGSGSGDFPKYSYVDEMATPRELGISRDGSFDGIQRATAGINYYADTIGFGTATSLAKMSGMQQSPLGVRFFTKTGITCSNGANMYEYVDTIPKGDSLGPRVTNELRAMGLPQMQGLAPGIMEDAVNALDFRPMMMAAAGSGYAQCKKVTLPVGDGKGRVKSAFDANNVWIKDPYTMKGGRPHQTRWVFDKWISMEEWDAAPKTQAPDAQVKEGFLSDVSGAGAAFLDLRGSQTLAVLLLAGLGAAYLLHK